MKQTSIKSPTAPEGFVEVLGFKARLRAWGRDIEFFIQISPASGQNKLVHYATGVIVVSFESERMSWMIRNCGTGGRVPKIGPKLLRQFAAQALARVEARVDWDRFASQIEKYPVINP